MTNASTETKPKAAHTPGPWAVNPFNAQVDAFVGGEPLPVCQLLWPTDERTEEETFANARLIAAAPDLLEALVTLVEAEPGTMTREMWDDARAAIAKARGES